MLNADLLPPIPNLPPQIKEAAEHGELVLFIGSGCSCLLGYPNWNQYADRILAQVFSFGECEQLRILNARTKISIAISVAETRNIKIKFPKALKHEFDNEAMDNQKRLREALLGISLQYVTTNYDTELDDMLNSNINIKYQTNIDNNSINLTYKPIIIYNPQDCSYDHCFCRYGYIQHIHGSIKDEPHMVQSLRDYIHQYHVNYGNNNDSSHYSKPVLDLLTRLFHEPSKTVLFIGYGLEEMEILEYIFQKVDTDIKKSNRHFLLRGFFSHQLNLSKMLNLYFQEHCGVQLIPFNMDHKNYDQLIDVLESFSSQINRNTDNMFALTKIKSLLADSTDIQNIVSIAKILSDDKSNYSIQKIVYEHIMKDKQLNKYYNIFNKYNLLSVDCIPVITKIKMDDGNYSYNSTYWPAQDYLIKMSHNGECVDDIKRTIWVVTNMYNENKIKYSYRHLFLGFAQMFSNMPMSKLQCYDLSLVEIWLKADFDTNQMAMNELFKTLIPRYLSSRDVRNQNKACYVLKICTEIHYVENEIVAGRQEPCSFINKYWLNENLKKTASEFGAVTGGRSAVIFRNRLKSISINDKNGHFSVFKRPAIEEHKQNKDSDEDILGIFTTGLRDCMCGWVEKNAEKASQYLVSMLSDEYVIVRRVAISVIDQNWQTLACLADDVFESDIFDKYMLHETYNFIKHHFHQISKTAQNKILAKLRSVHSDKYNENTQFVYLDLMQGMGNKQADKWYMQLKNKNKYSVSSHPDFVFYISDIWRSGKEHSPYSDMDILGYAADNSLIRKLNDFKPKSDSWDSPAIEDLVSALEDVIKNNPKHFSIMISEFENAKAPYQYALIRAFYDLWNQKKEAASNWSQIWTDLLSLTEAILSQDEVWQTIEETEDDYSACLLNMIPELLKSAVKDDQVEYTSKCYDRGMKILKKFLVKMKRNCKSNIISANEHMTMVDYAINSLEGKVFDSYINNIFHECRLADKSLGNHDVIFHKYEDTLNKELSLEYAPNSYFYSIIAMYLPKVLYISEQWTIDNIHKIFPLDNSEQFRSATDGFISFVNFTKRHFELLGENTWNKILSIDTQNQNLFERIYGWIALAYIVDDEKLDGKHLVSLYDASNVKALTVVAETMNNSIRDEDIEEYREKILAFWHKTAMWFEAVKPSNSSALCMQLYELTQFMEHIDDKYSSAYIQLFSYRPQELMWGNPIWKHINKIFDIKDNQSVIIKALCAFTKEQCAFCDDENSMHELLIKIANISSSSASLACTIADKLGSDFNDLYVELSRKRQEGN